MSDPTFATLLDGLSGSAAPGLAAGIRRGIEKESLRVDAQGRLAQSPHPLSLGSPLTHPSITTDFSEALLELITAPHPDAAGVLGELSDIHRFVYRHIDGELLWASSMPCVIGRDDEIPVARYGSSNVARMKTVYRVGLGHRYGRVMQTIAGIHYNFSLDDAFWERLRALHGASESLQDFKTAQYFALIRNFHRFSWLLIYLFGASPALCRSFVAGRTHGLDELAPCTLHAPWATSLRMGDLGYQSDAQQSIDVPYNGLGDYVDALIRAIREPHPAYVAIGTRRDGEWLQLSTSLLQIENEFYSTIRPKRVTRSGESPRHALAERGVEYIEVRCIDIDPFEPVGIGAGTTRFLDAFLLFCLLHASPPSDAAARERSRVNLRAVVMRGREPGLRLLNADGHAEPLRDWALRLLEGIAAIAMRMDAGPAGLFTAAVDEARRRVEDPERTPSARVLREIADCGNSYGAFAMRQSLAHRARFLAEEFPAGQQQGFEQMARESLAEQAAIEAADTLDFAEYLARYYRQ
ncbi:MAG: glutamate--cysteine ligase [Gammaproteobacteria bacterium]